MQAIAFLTVALAVGAYALPDHINDQTIFLSFVPNIKHTSEAERDRVHSLPGAEELDFDLFAGYITVDDDAGRALFYTLAESSSIQPDRDPLVLFLNGGPGCSSLGGGLMSELGPFYPTPEGGGLVRNEYAWNKLANVLFLESPAFVGWSYSNTSADAIVGDERTAQDSYEFLLRFLERFPKYQDRPFWLAGESYAGHYLPNLAVEILHGQKKNHKLMNFKGFLLGNPLTVPEIDSAGALGFWYTHGIISEDSYHSALKYCDLTAIEPLQEINDSLDREEVVVRKDDGDDRQKCEDFIVQAMDEMAGINIYDIYADVCINPTNKQQQRERKTNQGSPQPPFNTNLNKGNVGAFISSFLGQPPQPRYDPCISNEVEIYMNRPDVQAAFNANSSEHRQPGPWVTCTPHIAYSRKDVLTSMLPVYDQLLSSGLEFLIYSGDVDAIVPIIGTRNWIRKLDLEVEEKWRAWRSSTGQVAGWTVRHTKGLTFASVRGAGHMVPYTQAERAYHLFSRWVHGKPL